MKTIEITHPAHPLQVALGALRSSSKRPGVVKTLPKLCYALPSVVLEADACGRLPQRVRPGTGAWRAL